MFLCCVLYCFREMTVAFAKDHCVKKKKGRQNQVTVVPRSGAEVADDISGEKDFSILHSNSTLKAAFKAEEQYRRDSASRQSLHTKRRNKASSRLLQRLSDRDGREVVQGAESLADSDEEEQRPSHTESVVATAMAAEARYGGESEIREALVQSYMEIEKTKLLKRLMLRTSRAVPFSTRHRHYTGKSS